MRQSQLPPNLEWNITELVLDSFPTLDATTLGTALREEFAQQLAEQNLSCLLAQQDPVYLDNVLLEVPQDSSAQAVAQQIVQAIVNRPLYNPI
jgi:hypothetical protein